MADKFNPRGAPVPQNPYDGWDLTHQPAMLPFLAEYTNAQGDKAGGWAMPTMVEEPINALSRLLNTPAGTMPDPQDPQNRQDALTGLLSLYGGNAVGGMARGALGRGAARGLEMEAARPVAYSNGIEQALSNPNMLRMMDDIDYANLNRRALDDYGVGYEGLSSSQEAALRGWSDPSTSADAGRMGVMDYGKAAYLTARHPFEKTTADLSDPIAIWDQFHFSPKEGGDLQNFPYWTDEGNIFTNYPLHGEDTFAGRSGPNRLSNDRGVPGDVEAYRGRPATSLDVIDGGLLSDTGKPSILGSTVSSGGGRLDPSLTHYYDSLGLHPDGLLSEDIAKAARDGGSSYYGIRTTEAPVQVGERLAPSRVWDDGVPTSETLDGVSTVGLNLTPEGIASARRSVHDYFGKNVSLVGSDFRTYGADPGEFILKNGEVLATAQRPIDFDYLGRGYPLFSDTGKPSLLGALLSAGQDKK